MKNASGIYKITNTANGKCYVGSAVNIAARWSVHLNLLHNNKHHSIHLQRAFNKWGECAFEFSVVEIVPDIQMLTSVEQHHIDQLKPEYNICKAAGSCLGVKRSEEFKRKISERQTGNQYALGYKHSAETCAKTSAAAMGRKHSPETIAKMSAAHMGRKLSAEHIAKRSAAYSKPVSQFTLNMEFVAEYKSILAAKEATGAGHIGACCNGKRKTSSGFVWEFVTNMNTIEKENK